MRAASRLADQCFSLRHSGGHYRRPVTAVMGPQGALCSLTLPDAKLALSTLPMTLTLTLHPPPHLKIACGGRGVHFTALGSWPATLWRPCRQPRLFLARSDALHCTDRLTSPQVKESGIRRAVTMPPTAWRRPYAVPKVKLEALQATHERCNVPQCFYILDGSWISRAERQWRAARKTANPTPSFHVQHPLPLMQFTLHLVPFIQKFHHSLRATL